MMLLPVRKNKKNSVEAIKFLKGKNIYKLAFVPSLSKKNKFTPPKQD